MSDQKALLEKRNRMKKKKPGFIRKDHNKKRKLGVAWRGARGLHNKQRLRKKGHVKTPSSGYGSPKKVKGTHKSGLFPVLVTELSQLSSLKKDTGVILSSRLGDRKRKIITEEIKKKGLVLLNRDADKTIARIEADLKERQAERRKRLEKQKEKKKGIEEKVKKEEAKKKEEKSEEKKLELTEEEKKKLEKQEKDKLLTKRT